MRSEILPTGQRSFIEEARRAQIIAAAIEVIAAGGFAKASLAAIAKHAGISKGVISYHFAGKDELMEEVVNQIYDTIAERVLTSMKGQETATELLRTQVLSVAGHMRGHRTQLQALGEIFHNLRDAAGKPRYGVQSSEELYTSLERLYELGQRTGEFRSFDIRVMAVTHSAAIDAMFEYWVVHPEHDLDAHAIELADLLESAVK
ncbi:transcriptional regulator, TetR family [Streptosporangium canum]|uniref:Transcriptional regulator, TetR family n=1 Tax=Streptosporangium canum TaxID=324952 RepID=A0A1I4BVM5_9ACTN|nr:TetR/AcrR family transcriptional regulator [Streptosporangium canum]SFK72470.1 transcriptional regulator, TetR family [Streptosporangium canum]